MWISACSDSTSDVANTSRDDESVLPDTVMVYDGVTVEMYGFQNARAQERASALSSSAGVRLAVDRITERGFVLEDSGAIFMRATAPDGRTLEATWFPAIDPTRVELSGVLHLRRDGEDFVVPLGDRSAGEPEVLSPEGKKIEPSFGSMFGGCLSFAQDLFMACVSTCMQDGIPNHVCMASCRAAAIAALASCALLMAVEQ